MKKTIYLIIEYDVNDITSVEVTKAFKMQEKASQYINERLNRNPYRITYIQKIEVEE